MPQSILIIEDDETVRSSLALALKDANFDVAEAADASQAMHQFLHRPPDLVLLDLGITGDDDMVMLRSMKKVRPGTPVIIVSGRTHITDAIEAFKAGAWDYVTKPIASMDVFINSLHNCLAQVRLQRRVQDTQEHLFRLIQNLPVIIFIINRNLEFEFLNQTTEQILGYSPQEILESPKPFLKCVVPEDRKKFLDTLKKSFEPAAGEFRLEFRFLHKKGYPVSLQAQSIIYPQEDGAASDRVEGMIMDVTRNSYLDKLLLQNEKLNMLRIITEEVAHEIRNPLVALGGFARQLRVRYPEALETKVMLEECNRLERLVQRISTYLEPMEVHLADCSLPATLAFILRLLSSRLEGKAITCAVDLDDKLDPVLADQEFLHRIFIYLIGHSADIVEQSGTIRIAASNSDSLVQVTLAADPVHIVRRAQNRRIMPFGDEDANLAICYRLVERIGGHLHMEHMDSTALFTVSIPKYPYALAGGEAITG